MRVRPRSTAPGPISVSGPISTSASTAEVSAARKVTPARACRSMMRRRASVSTSISAARSLIAHRDGRVRGRVDPDGVPALAEDREDRGEVALAGLLGHGRERVEQGLGVERVGAEVDLANGELGRVDPSGGLGLDDPLERPVGRTDHPAVPGGVELVGREHRRRRPRTGVRRDELGDQLGGDQRVVPGQGEHRAGPVEPLARGADRRAGALALDLLDRLDAGRESLGHAVTRPGYAYHASGAGLLRGADHPVQHRPSADRVEHLRKRRAHARPAPGGHDQSGGGVGHGVSVQRGLDRRPRQRT